jgi:uncharacterized protein (TIGR03067 family)
MTSANPVHPPKSQLIAFGQGKLAADESTKVEQHLEVCRECCETLLDLKEDTFYGLVRDARPLVVEPASADVAAVVATEADAAPGGEPADRGVAEAATLAVQSGETLGPDELPIELAEHPRYRIVELIGRGGMGCVYRAEHRLMNRAVAIKVINPQLVHNAQAVERFRREVQAAAKLSHPNIVTAYDAEQAGNAHFLVMEFVEGTDLASVVNKRGRMSVAEACESIRQAADGLEHAHERGMVHRDIKPHNLMLTASGQVRILDFGLAGFASEESVAFRSAKGNPFAEQKATMGNLTSIGAVMGTPDYMAPEQAADAHTADIRADIYSLGCTLHFLLTGKPPYEADSVVAKLMAHVDQSPPSLASCRNDVVPELSAVVARMMAKDPAVRFQTPAEVAAALAPFAKPAAPPPRRRKRTLVAAALVAAATLLASVIFVTTDKGRIEITSDVDDVEVVVRQGGKEIKTIDLQTGSQVTWLPSGDYEISLKQNRNDIDLDRDGFTLSRWGKQIVRVKLVPAAQLASDRDRLQGTWVVESGQRNGQPTPLDQVGMQRAVFDGDKLHAVMPGGITGDGYAQLVETTQPKQIWLQVQGENKGMRGIYKIDGDRLTLCMDQDAAGEIPKSFAAPAGTTIDLIVMRRERSTAEPAQPPATPFEAVLHGQNRQITGNSLPVVVFARDGKAAFRFGNWLLLFEGVPCKGDAKAAGLLGIGSFNYPLRGGRGTVGDTTFGNQVTFRGRWDGETSEITIADKYTFKLLGKGDRIEFTDNAYDAKASVQSILIAADGATRVLDNAAPLASNVSDLDRLQGKWVAVSGHARKQAMPAEQLAMLSITFDGERVTLTQPGNPPQSNSGTFKINANSVPKQITFVAPDPKKETLPGIYEFDGEQLKLAFVDEDYSRPTNFDPDDRADHMTLVLERAPLTGPALGPTEREVLKAAHEFLAVMDAGRFGQLFDMSASWAKRSTTREKTSRTHQTIRDSFGKAIHRTLHRAHLLDRAPQVPEGRYAGVQYKSRFERQEVLWETVLLNVDTDGKWRVNTYAWTLEEPTLPEPSPASDDPATTQKKQAARAAADEWLKLVDAGNYGESWETSAASNKQGIAKQQMSDVYKELFQPLGPMKSREFKSSEYRTQLPGAPAGEYAVIQFTTQFANQRMVETVVLTKEADGEWRVSGYFHGPGTITPNPTSGSAAGGDKTPKC